MTRKINAPTGAELIVAFKATGAAPNAMVYDEPNDRGVMCACAVGVLAARARDWVFVQHASDKELFEVTAAALGMTAKDLKAYESGVLARHSDHPSVFGPFGRAGYDAWGEVMAAVERGELPRA